MTDDDLSPKLVKLVEEAAELHEAVLVGEVSDSLPTIHERLLRCRANGHRLEEIVADLTRLKGKTRRKVKDARAHLDDAWDVEATRKVVGFSAGDAAPRERYAHYNSRVVDERIGVRLAELADDHVDTALEICRWYHQGVEATRWTLNSRIRLLTVDTRLES